MMATDASGNDGDRPEIDLPGWVVSLVILALFAGLAVVWGWVLPGCGCGVIDPSLASPRTHQDSAGDAHADGRVFGPDIASPKPQTSTEAKGESSTGGQTGLINLSVPISIPSATSTVGLGVGLAGAMYGLWERRRRRQATEAVDIVGAAIEDATREGYQVDGARMKSVVAKFESRGGVVDRILHGGRGSKKKRDRV